MECQKCKFDNRKGAKFCKECGSKLELVCPECGYKFTLPAKFCDECGYDLSKAPTASPVNYSDPQSYTPKYLAEKIFTNRSSIEGENKHVTVLFADVSNYTTISEKLNPEEVHQIMDGCFKILMDEIHKYEGTVNQFTGDGVMAIFGAPLAHEEHAQRACYAALSIQKTIHNYSEKLRNKYDIDFKMRIGLNSGPVVVGSIGDDLRMDYTAIGDTTNLAARMEGLANPGTISVSGNTHRLTKDYFEFGPIRTVEVKGKRQPQKSFELLKESEIGSRIEAATIKGLTRFVGRKNSMASLMEAYHKAHSGSGQVVGIVGDAGLGKSRILLEFKNRLPKDDITYLEGRCLNYGDSISYLPIIDILKRYFQIKEDEKESIAKEKMREKVFQLDSKLEGNLPAMYDLLSIGVANENFQLLEPQQKRDMIFESIKDVIIRESQNSILVIAIEDLHWIDKTSEEFLSYLIGWIARSKILLILLYRPEYTHQWGSKSYYNRIGLDHLTAKSSVELVQAILADGKVLPELKELISDRAVGNPLYMEEFTKTLLESGSIKKKDEKYVLIKKVSGLQIPDNVYGIIAARIDRLEDNLKQTIQEASVIGRVFTFRVLQAITKMKEKIKPNLLSLQLHEFIYEKSLFPEIEYIFRHTLTQEVAYNSLLIKNRKKIHEKIGRAIEQIYQDRLEEFYEILAYHYAKSESSEKAYHYLKLSGKKATRNYSNWEAFCFYREAIDVLSGMPSSEQNIKEGIYIRLSLAVPAMFLSYPEDSIDELKIGVKLAKEIVDTVSLAKLNGTLSHAFAIKGESILSIEHAEKCFQEAEEIKDLNLMAPVARDLTSAYMFAGEMLKAVSIFTRVIPLIEEANKRSETFGRPSSVYTFICGLGGFISGIIGSFVEGESLCNKACFNASKSNNLYELSYSEFSYGIYATQRGDGRYVVDHLERCIKYLEKSQMATLLDIALASLGLGYVFQGNLNKARKLAKRALSASYEQEAASGNAIMTQAILAMVFMYIGDQKKAHSCATTAVKLSTEHKVGGWEGMSWSVLGMVLADSETQRFEEAADCINKALPILKEYEFQPEFARATLVLADVYFHLGHQQKALLKLKEAIMLFKDMGMDYHIAQTYALYAKYYRKTGNMIKAKEYLGVAIELLKACGVDGLVKKYEKEIEKLES